MRQLQQLVLYRLVTTKVKSAKKREYKLQKSSFIPKAQQVEKNVLLKLPVQKITSITLTHKKLAFNENAAKNTILRRMSLIDHSMGRGYFLLGSQEQWSRFMRSHASGPGSEYSHDVTAAILLIQTNPVRDGLFSYVKNFKSAKSPLPVNVRASKWSLLSSHLSTVLPWPIQDNFHLNVCHKM